MGTLDDGGKYLSDEGLRELIRLIKVKDARQIEKIKIDDSDLTMTTGEDGYNRVVIPNAEAPSTEGGSDGHTGLMTAQDKWKLDHSEAAALAGVNLNGTLLEKNQDNEALLVIKQNGTNITVDSTTKSIDVDVPIMSIASSLDGTETAITPDANHKAVVDLSALIPRSKIQTDFSQTISATDTIAQAKAIKEYVDSKAHISFSIVDNDNTKDVYYVEDSTTHVRTITKQASFTPEPSTIYLVPEYGERGGHAEYFWDAAKSEFELMGRTDVDLSDYVKYTDILYFTTAEVDAIWNAI